MNVKQLIEKLSKLDQTLEVCIMGNYGHGEPAFPTTIKDAQEEINEYNKEKVVVIRK